MKKLDIEVVKDVAYQKGFILLDNEYKGDRFKMNWIDQEGYKYYVTYQTIKKGIPAKYSKSNPYTIENMNHFFQKHDLDYKYLFGDYINCQSKLTWIDSQGYKYYYNFQNMRTNARPVSVYNKYSIDNIKQYIINNNRKDTLLSTEYKSNGSKNKEEKLIFQCPNGHVFEKTWNDYQSGQGCRKCIQPYRNLEEFKEEVFKKYGNEYTILGEYVNSQTNIKIRHNKCGTEYSARPTVLIQGHGCPNRFCCRTRGENHYRWNPMLTDEERAMDYSRLSEFGYYQWRQSVFKRDNRSCVLCGSKKSLNAHHLYSWNKYIDLRFDINNGVTLCENCHKGFHKIYGNGDNTKEQFEEYKNSYGNTEVS